MSMGKDWSSKEIKRKIQKKIKSHIEIKLQFHEHCFIKKEEKTTSTYIGLNVITDMRKAYIIYKQKRRKTNTYNQTFHI